jgi:hypothetical protein
MELELFVNRQHRCSHGRTLYSPPRSRTFSAKSGSSDHLKEFPLRGLSPNALHRDETRLRRDDFPAHVAHVGKLDWRAEVVWWSLVVGLSAGGG